MPCSCDGYQEDDTRRARDALENETKLRCRAQSLAHKLAKELEKRGGVPSELVESVARERASLIAHKRGEHQRDMAPAEARLRTAWERIRKIEALGDVPGAELVAERDHAATERNRLDAVTDAELLG